MADEIPRVEFKASVDESADAGLRYLRSTDAGRAIRRRDAVRSGVISGATLFVVAMTINGWASWLAAVFIGGLAVVWALVFWWVYSALIYDRAVLKRLRAFAVEQLGNRDAFECVIELRPEGAWIRQNDAEVLLPWKDAVAVRDAEDGVELVFRSGFILARDRGFASVDQRAAFLARAQVLADPNVRSVRT